MVVLGRGSIGSAFGVRPAEGAGLKNLSVLQCRYNEGKVSDGTLRALLSTDTRRNRIHVAMARWTG